MRLPQGKLNIPDAAWLEELLSALAANKSHGSTRSSCLTAIDSPSFVLPKRIDYVFRIGLLTIEDFELGQIGAGPRIRTAAKADFSDAKPQSIARTDNATWLNLSTLRFRRDDLNRGKLFESGNGDPSGRRFGNTLSCLRSKRAPDAARCVEL
jgi:hypothetical protein